MIFTTRPSQTIKGILSVPGDKSISHRSIMLGSLAKGITTINGFLEGEDCLATLQAFRDMGVLIDRQGKGSVIIHGVGMRGLKAPQKAIDLGNSGTAMRLISGVLAAQSFDSILIGDASLSSRPMKRIMTPLLEMNAVIEAEKGGTPPLAIKGGQTLQAIHYNLPIASAQVKSCVLLSGLYAQGETSITEPAVTRDHTERMLRSFGYTVVTNGNSMSLKGGGELKGTTIDVPADISSAAFFMVAATIADDAEVTLKHVGINPTRTGVIDILQMMGANITLENRHSVGDEPVADIIIRSAQLNGIDIPEALIPLAIDEFPVIFIAAAFAKGVTRLTGAEELRVKESDRIQVMADGLLACGVDAQATLDGIIIKGAQTMNGGVIDSHGDHRIAMAFSVAGIRSTTAITIHQCDNVATSFPDFIHASNSVGMLVSQMD